MKNFRNQFRKGVTIVACLAVTTMFVACDKADDNGNGGGKIDKELIGHWWYYSSMSGYSYYYHYWFNADGTFTASYPLWSYVGESSSVVEGKYKTSDGKIYMTDLEQHFSSNASKKEKWGNKVVDYSIGKNEGNSYFLKIKNLGDEENFINETPNTQTYWKE